MELQWLIWWERDEEDSYEDGVEGPMDEATARARFLEYQKTTLRVSLAQIVASFESV